MSDVKVLQVPRGSLIVMNGVNFPPEGDVWDRFVDELTERCGHDKFVILNVAGDGTAEVFGSVDEAIERVRSALDEVGIPSTRS